MIRPGLGDWCRCPSVRTRVGSHPAVAGQSACGLHCLPFTETRAEPVLAFGRKGIVMSVSDGPSNITQVLDCVVHQVDGDRVTLEDILRRLGTRSYGPGLFLISFISMLPPISITPGLPVITGSVTLLLAAQLLVLRPYPWLPRRLLRVSFAREKLERVVVRARPWA